MRLFHARCLENLILLQRVVHRTHHGKNLFLLESLTHDLDTNWSAVKEFFIICLSVSSSIIKILSITTYRDSN